NTCQNRDLSYVDEYSGLMTNLRLAELAMHAIAIIIMCICFIAALALIIVWYKKNIDNKCFRNWRLIIGIFLMLAGKLIKLCKQQRTTTSITYGSGYILLWLATIFCFISAWIFLGTYCCWTLDDVDTDDDNYQPSLPRYSTESGDINRRGSTVIYSDD
ncbi:hypothetical protein EWB00_009864, partial [Schistosoma japonicum]